MESDLIMMELKTPIGLMRLFACSGELVSIELPREGLDTSSNVVSKHGSVDPVFQEAVEFIEQYFRGEPVSWAGKDIPDGRDFFREIWTEAARIPFGQTVSYGELAQLTGHPRAVRGVGSAMANNPLPILVPCHRVIGADGTLHGFGGGLDMKRWLLRHEGVNIEK
ncbi:MGMT family protein [bacterium]|nr:MGMT family protein [bacterium]